MAENNDKDLAYRVLCGKTPVLDIYFDGSYKIRTDIPEEERSKSAKGFHYMINVAPEGWFEFWLYDKEHRVSNAPDERYAPPSDEYLKAFRILRKYDFTPDYMDEDVDKDTEVEVFGGAKVPWGKIEDGFFSGATSVYICHGEVFSVHFN